MTSLNKSLNDYLDEQISKFIDASIARASLSKSTVYRYRIPVRDLKSMTMMIRVHGEPIIRYVEKYNVECSLDVISDAFFVDVDLLKCVLSPAQSVAMMNACSK